MLSGFDASLSRQYTAIDEIVYEAATSLILVVEHFSFDVESGREVGRNVASY